MTLFFDDCDDLDPGVMAQSNDADCDGVLALDDCDDNNPLSVLDMDCDGYSSTDDCNDLDTEISPLSSEICDGIDNDCDGAEDNGATDSTPWYLDLDQDGYGDGEDIVIE